jgi:hypothetical protein
MTNYEFSALSENEKLSIIFNNATYLDKIMIEGQARLLYALGNFYIEVSYDEDKKNPAIKYFKVLRTFKNISQLEPYLININKN